MASIKIDEVQNEDELTDEGVKGNSISSTLGGKRPAPSAAEGGSSEDEVRALAVDSKGLRTERGQGMGHLTRGGARSEQVDPGEEEKKNMEK